MPNPDAEGAILALDLGSSKMKSAWVRPDGRMYGLCRIESPVRTRGASAQDVWSAVAALLARQISSAQAPGRILGLVLTGLTRTHVFLDTHGSVTGPLIRWDDPYGETCADEVATAYGVDPGTNGFGAFHPLARLVQRRRDTGAAPAAMLELRDWLNYRLAGRCVTDAVAYGRLHGTAATATQALEALGFASSVIPPARTPTRRLGQVRKLEDPGLRPLAGVPLITGSFDTWCSTLGMGAIVEGCAYDISGTTEVMGSFSTTPAAMLGMVCLRWTPTLWQVGGPCLTGLGTLAWFARGFLDADDPAATLAAARLGTSATPPLCLPYINGERMPWWRSDLPASFHEVRTQHTRNDFARALVEGLVLAHRVALDEAGIRAAGTRLHLGGGGSALADWCQMRADAFGLPLAIGENPESALVGAALAAAVALGYHADLPAAQRTVRARGITLQPDPDRKRYFDERAAAYGRLLQQALRTTPT